MELFYTEFNRILEKTIKDIFGKHRISVNCEWYDMSVIKEIKNYIIKQIQLYNEFKVYSELNTIDEIINEKSDDTKSQILENKETENKRSINDYNKEIINNFSENSNHINQLKNNIPIYINEKICKNCNKNLNHKYFFFIDKNNRIYSDQCLSCFENENNKEIKQCSKCHIVKDKTNFVADKTKKDGLTYDCKDCRKDFNKIIKQKNSLNGKKECTLCKEYKFYKMFFIIETNNKNDLKYSEECKECFCKNNGNHKQCFSCKHIKQYNQFDLKSSSKDGLETYCKECRKIKRDQTRNAKQEILKEKNMKQCLICQKHLKFNQFFKNNGEYFEQCMECYTPESLQCNKCNEIKLKSCFSKDVSKKSGHRTICKICTGLKKKIFN